MNRSTMRLIGIVFLVAAAALMLLNLRRMGDLGTFWAAIPLFVVGLAFIARARKARL